MCNTREMLYIVRFIPFTMIIQRYGWCGKVLLIYSMCVFFATCSTCLLWISVLWKQYMSCCYNVYMEVHRLYLSYTSYSFVRRCGDSLKGGFVSECMVSLWFAADQCSCELYYNNCNINCCALHMDPYWYLRLFKWVTHLVLGRDIATAVKL